MVGKKWIYVLIIFLIVALRFSYMDVNHENYYWDEVVYLHLAENINNGGYYSHIGEEFRAPMFPFLLSLFGYGHFFVFCLVVIGIVLMYFLGKEIFNEEVGLISAVILGSMSLYFFYSFKLLTEPLTLILLIGAILLVYKYERLNKNYFLYLGIICAGLAVLTRYVAGAMALSIFLYLLYKKRWKELLISGGIFLVVLSPLYILGMLNYGNPLGMLISNLVDNTSKHGGVFYYFIHIYPILGWFIPAAFVYGLFSKENKKPMLFFIVTYFIVLEILALKYDRFFILMFPFIAVIAARGIYKLNKKYKIGMLFLAIWVVVSLSVGLVHIDMDRSNTALLVNSAQDLDLEGNIVSNSPVYFSYFGNQEVDYIPIVETDIGSIDYFIIDNYHPREEEYYLIYTNFIKANGTLVYNMTEGHREVVVYATES